MFIPPNSTLERPSTAADDSGCAEHQDAAEYLDAVVAAVDHECAAGNCADAAGECADATGQAAEPNRLRLDRPAAYSSPLEALLTDALAEGEPLHLARASADADQLARLRQLCRRRALLVCREQPGTPYLALDQRWHQPELNLNFSRRSDLRRARRKAEQIGPIGIEILAPRADALDGWLETLRQIDGRGEAIDGKASRAACDIGALRIGCLRIAGQPAAVQLASLAGGRFQLLLSACDPALETCSPGLLLLRETIAYAACSGVSSYEFAGPADAASQFWTTGERPMVSLSMYPLNLRGMAAFARQIVLGARSR